MGALRGTLVDRCIHIRYGLVRSLLRQQSVGPLGADDDDEPYLVSRDTRYNATVLKLTLPM